MKKIILFVFLALTFFANQSFAVHGKGGWIHYKYLGPGTVPGTSKYHITATFYYSCTSTNTARTTYIGIYDAKTFANIALDTLKNNPKMIVTKTKDPITKITTYDTVYVGNRYSEHKVIKQYYAPCLNPAPPIDSTGICYSIATYDTSAVLTDNANGYVVALIGNGGRTAPLTDIIAGSGNNTGNETFATLIPGIFNGVQAHNSSPTFLFKDTAILCYGSYFTYQFTAVDSVDHDSISYSFVPATTASNSDKNVPPNTFYSLNYNKPLYSANSPLGSGVTINPATGLISGYAPSATGQYLINVCAKEWRNGVLMDSVVKEMQVEVNNCTISGAELKKVYVNCDSLTLPFENLSTASNIKSYLWIFGDSTNGQPNISTDPLATHTYHNPGDYTMSLQVTVGDSTCVDRVQAQVHVYPGFKTKMSYVGSCYQSPFTFTDASTTTQGNGTVSWKWSFGDASANATTNPVNHQFPQQLGSYKVVLWDSTVKGCVGTDTETVVLSDKPYIGIPKSDYIVCSNHDTATIEAQIAPGASFSWSPTPNVYPDSTMPEVVPTDSVDTYTITVNAPGCLTSSTASIKVHQVPYFDVSFVSPDTMHVCRNDHITLTPTSNSAVYSWTESDSLLNTTINNTLTKSATVTPVNDTTVYYVTVNPPGCQKTASITVYTSDPPKITSVVSAAPTICFGDSTTLTATIQTDPASGAFVSWSNSKDATTFSNTLTPKVAPTDTATYTIKVYNSTTSYCSKPTSASVIVNVVPNSSVTFRAHDTSVCKKDTFSLNPISIAKNYAWTESDGLKTLSDTSSKSPNAFPSSDLTTYYVISNPALCPKTDSIKVHASPYPKVKITTPAPAICFGDSTTLSATTPAPAVAWSPTNSGLSNYNILTTNASPANTTLYTISATDKTSFCPKAGTDTITVTVFPHVDIRFNATDTNVCKNDSFYLNPICNTIHNFAWSESDGLFTLSDSLTKNPKVSPRSDLTVYHIRILNPEGRCEDGASIRVHASPYPTLSIISPASKDTIICFGDTAKLAVAPKAASIVWTPVTGLLNSTSFSTIATPTTTTKYKVTVKDTFYCTKTTSDFVTIFVQPQFAIGVVNDLGNDSAIVVPGDSIRLHAFVVDSNASFIVTYKWTAVGLPSDIKYLSSSITSDPYFKPTDAVSKDNLPYIHYTVTATSKGSCHSSTDYAVKVFNALPDLLVPTVFINNGRTRMLTPVPVGITEVLYFRVYNRMGQLVFSTTDLGKGWDGMINGSPADAGTYVWMAQGKDYKGKIHQPQTGTVILLR